MMKKIVATAFFTIAAVSQVNAAVFNGFAIGANGGITVVKTRHGGHEKVLGTYGLQLDYDISKANSLYTGLGLDFSVYSGKAGNHDISYRYNWSTEADFRLGYNFCNQTALYGIVGVKAVNSKAKVYNDTKKHTKAAAVLGAGVKTKITDKVSAGVEYRHAFKNDHKVTNHAVLARVSYHF